MHHFHYSGSALHCESVDLAAVAGLYGTPTYVYSAATMEDNFRRLQRGLAGLDARLCYAMKANSSLAVLRHFSNLGAGFDLVSGGEVRRVLAAGGNVRASVFAGVGKTEGEIELALRNGIFSFHVESEPELARINHVAGKLGVKAPVAIRVNPDVDAHTHAKITTLEHGRFMVGNAGALIARVEHLKRGANRNFLVVDAAMNDLVRPAMYDSYHEIVPLHRDSSRRALVADIVGPICESGDCFAKERQLQELGEGELLAFLSAGAYGYTMASRYNTRGMAAEVMVRGSAFELVNARETFEQIIAGEKVPAFLQ